MKRVLFGTVLGLVSCCLSQGAERPSYSGVYPHLAFFNEENECGTGAVVPWAGRLWVITYGPHLPFGSSDKLYEIDEQLNAQVRPESVGGTPANRMIHRESNQLFIGPYVINTRGDVRVIPPRAMPGRLTGNARHLFEPSAKVYFATMEEGFYEVDVNSLAVTVITPDGNAVSPPDVAGSLLPGYHGKGLYSGQSRLIYANNGEMSEEALRVADIPSGCLAEWDGKAWSVVRRNQFTEVTGPGGLMGNTRTEDPIWSIGWDDLSLILMVRDGDSWSSARLPKASHTYDGAHGWHTEWPRIRQVSRDQYLMTMHGMLWDFPSTWSANNMGGLRPLSSYLKVIGDFAGWQGRVVFGCDDAARVDFRTERSSCAVGSLSEQSNSNLWFVSPEDLSRIGPVIGRGAVWKSQSVKAGAVSDPFLIAGFDRRVVHVAHESKRPIRISLEIDSGGSGEWKKLASLTVPASGYLYQLVSPEVRSEWVRVRTESDCERLTVFFHLAGEDRRSSTPDPLFAGLAKPTEALTGGVLLGRGGNRGTLHFAASKASAGGPREELGLYEIGPEMKLRRVADEAAYREVVEKARVLEPCWSVDTASVVLKDPTGRRFRLPIGEEAFWKASPLGWPRSAREVTTERDLLNCAGTIYEVPRENSGGIAKLRPVTTHNLQIMDMCSWRGLLVVSGVSQGPVENSRVIVSDDGSCSLWLGAVDDLWKLGKPRGRGGPWKQTVVKGGEASDPYLMTGYDRKSLILSHDGTRSIAFAVEVDITGDGNWVEYARFTVEPQRTLTHRFPDGFNAYWVRLRTDESCRADSEFIYE